MSVPFSEYISEYFCKKHHGFLGLVQHKVHKTIDFDFFPIVCIAKTDKM